MHPIHVYNELKLNVIYSMDSGDGTYSPFRHYLALEQYGRGCILGSLTYNVRKRVSLSRNDVTQTIMIVMVVFYRHGDSWIVVIALSIPN